MRSRREWTMINGVVQRRLAGGVAGLLAAAGLVVASPSPGQAKARDTDPVVSGNARFEVLSPTLIRTEYAGDAHFVDAGTFNVVGRDDFRRTRYTKTVSNGWLTIDTGSVALRYKVDSGPFTADNLSVSLKAGTQNVVAAPWSQANPATCAAGALCEAEAQTLQGATPATDHGGYTGKGFAAGFQNTGDGLKTTLTVATAGDYVVDARYANSTGGDGQNVTRTLTVTIDGTAHTLTLPTTANWDTWAVAGVPVTLTAGSHQVSITRTATDSGNVNLDSFAVLHPGDAYPQPAPPAPQPCAYGTVCEADTGTGTGGARRADDHNGYSGAGFLAGLESTSASEALTVTGVPSAGTYQVQVRYANAKAGAQPVQTRTMSVNGQTLSLPPTSSWDYWRTVSVPVTLNAGTNTLTLGCPTATSCNVNIDTVAVTSTQSAMLAPHAPLGGYRRGLDGVNAGALTAPGILYQDGWSLLDDTASALWDPKSEKITQRTTTAGVPYQDGYVFGYGLDYSLALDELSTLTGPALLMPKWTYGVWYSEYFDRTDKEFEAIADRFKTEKVPLDALVVDTDFKAPDKWNGWEFDPTRFPDPKAFFKWAKKQDLHTALNIHPSILGSDPAFPAAQATAKGKLQRVGCNGGADCYVFDFGDPDQLKAYFQLHEGMEKQGADLWWLDWCCDSSKSTLTGVTPDAWINQQYADRQDFAFSRAYGSLQAGGYSNPVSVPTGPWADKRTTLHFTGDTISNWETMAFTVGYTPGESAATGLATISNDIGGHTQGLQEPGSEPGSTKLPDDLYARWVQLGTFQPIDRLHSNHSDRMPWQYGPAAEASAKKFLNLRKDLQAYTYSTAKNATRTGMPITRALYLAYPGNQDAYAYAGSEYLYGDDFLVAPVTTPGTSATTTVWFPPGDTWTDYFTGKKYEGGTTAQITTTLDTMPVFTRSGDTYKAK
ncbi:TIM-barrel domain-containing protein [Actinoplanes sp. N902-109]|uniref:TIM-barrel domain-containing protein n=1 Tax=Actinoplanes sp. (strain N902-109) TaxID=649831 RepID=UPI001E64DDC7|nr:TIM-barrel domain-containing protein [Actinoplanes sp. N902-109]